MDDYKSYKDYYNALDSLIALEINKFKQLSSKQKARAVFTHFNRYWNAVFGEGKVARSMNADLREGLMDRWNFQASQELNLLTEEEMSLYLRVVLAEFHKFISKGNNENMVKVTFFTTLIGRIPAQLNQECEAVKDEIVKLYNEHFKDERTMN